MEESWLRAFKARELIDRSHAVLENNQRDADVVLQMKRARRDRLWRYIKSKDKPPPRFQPSHNSKKDVQATVYQVEKVKAQRDLIRTSVSQSYITSCREDESLFFSESRANQVASMSHQRKLSHTRKKKTFWRSDMFDLKDAMAHHKQEFVRLLDHFTPDHLRALHRIFLRADLRSIGEEQFLQHVQTLVSPLTSQREGLKNIFREIDTDNDGQIRWADVAEFFANSLSGEHENSGEQEEDETSVHVYQLAATMPLVKLSVSRVEGITCLQDNDYIAVVAPTSNSVKLYNGETLTCEQEMAGHVASVVLVAELSGSDYIVTSGSDGCLIFWGKFTFHLRQTIPTAHILSCCSWWPEGMQLFVGTASGSVFSFLVPKSIETGVEVVEAFHFQAHTEAIPAILYLASMAYLVTSSFDGEVSLWHKHDDKSPPLLLHSFSAHSKAISQLAFCSSQKSLLTAALDHRCKVWNLLSFGQTPIVLEGHPSAIAGIFVVSSAPQHVITICRQAVVKVWDHRHFFCLHTIKVTDLLVDYLGLADAIEISNRYSVTSVAFSACKRRMYVAMATGGQHSTSRLLSLEYAGREEDGDRDGAIVWSSLEMRSKSIVVVSSFSVRVYCALNGSFLRRFVLPPAANLTSACLSSNGKLLVLGDEGGAVSIFSYGSGRLLKNLSPHSACVSAILFLEQSSEVVSAGWDRKIQLHDHSGGLGQETRTFSHFSSDITCMAYCSKNSILAAGEASGRVQLVTSGQLKLAGRCRGHTGEVTLLEFINAPDLSCLLSADAFGHLLLWSAPWSSPRVVCLFSCIVHPLLLADRATSPSPGPAPSRPLLRPHRDTPCSASFSASNKVLWVGTSSGYLISYNLRPLRRNERDWFYDKHLLSPRASSPRAFSPRRSSDVSGASSPRMALGERFVVRSQTSRILPIKAAAREAMREAMEEAEDTPSSSLRSPLRSPTSPRLRLLSREGMRWAQARSPLRHSPVDEIDFAILHRELPYPQDISPTVREDTATDKLRPSLEPIFDANCVKPLRCWRAHNEGVRSMQLALSAVTGPLLPPPLVLQPRRRREKLSSEFLADEPSKHPPPPLSSYVLLSCSARQVCAWDEGGEMLGKLVQASQEADEEEQL